MHLGGLCDESILSSLISSSRLPRLPQTFTTLIILSSLWSWFYLLNSPALFLPQDFSISCSSFCQGNYSFSLVTARWASTHPCFSVHTSRHHHTLPATLGIMIHSVALTPFISFLADGLYCEVLYT